VRERNRLWGERGVVLRGMTVWLNVRGENLGTGNQTVSRLRGDRRKHLEARKGGFLRRESDQKSLRGEREIISWFLSIK